MLNLISCRLYTVIKLASTINFIPIVKSRTLILLILRLQFLLNEALNFLFEGSLL
jgi:hypothetical protein